MSRYSCAVLAAAVFLALTLRTQRFIEYLAPFAAAAAALSASQQRTHGLEAVGGNEPARHQIPQALLHLHG